jgi:hypothetical protein
MSRELAISKFFSIPVTDSCRASTVRESVLLFRAATVRERSYKSSSAKKTAHAFALFLHDIPDRVPDIPVLP